MKARKLLHFITGFLLSVHTTSYSSLEKPHTWHSNYLFLCSEKREFVSDTFVSDFCKMQNVRM